MNAPSYAVGADGSDDKLPADEDRRGARGSAAETPSAQAARDSWGYPSNLIPISIELADLED
jgi:hypothetical protein